MTKIQSPFKFDHREMTVIFSLFIFTSLLMFTIGIVVGKSLAQPKTNEVAATEPESHSQPNIEKEAHAANPHSEGTSVSTGHPISKVGPEKASHFESVAEQVSAPQEHPKKDEHNKNHETTASAKDPAHSGQQELELIPEKPKTGDVRASLADLVDGGEFDKAIKNPKVQSLIESKPHVSAKPKKRSVASVEPKSSPEGKYTVQVGSYPSQADASSRVEHLRKLGYPFAYLSTKEIGDKKEPWYRVWLGYFPDSESAKASADLLQQRGEVKSYLVRKTDTNED